MLNEVVLLLCHMCKLHTDTLSLETCVDPVVVWWSQLFNKVKVYIKVDVSCHV